jgi:hypothetical protein
VATVAFPYGQTIEQQKIDVRPGGLRTVENVLHQDMRVPVNPGASDDAENAFHDLFLLWRFTMRSGPRGLKPAALWPQARRCML